jgi:hypothetical protein
MQATKGDSPLGSETDRLFQSEETYGSTSDTSYSPSNVLGTALDGVALHGDEGDCTKIELLIIVSHKHMLPFLSEASGGIVRQCSPRKATAW